MKQAQRASVAARSKLIAAVSAQPPLVYTQSEPSPVVSLLKLRADGSRQLSVLRERRAASPRLPWSARRLLQVPVQRHGTLYVASVSVACNACG